MVSLMTTVSQNLGLTSHLKDGISQHSVPLIALVHWGLFNHREDCPLLAHQHHFQQLSFPRCLPSKYITKP
uniref:Uncharacterized protein n=1 Tax=Anguilla anguilla TaxID=7936 RepID=A0A0E9VNB8_ANGAN